MKVKIRDRESGKLWEEPLFSELAMRFLFENRVGLWLSRSWLTKSGFSRLYGKLQSTAYSQRKIGKFCEKYNIQLDDFEEGPFVSFNAFFYRKLKPNRRPFPQDTQTMGACAEGRVLGFSKASDCNLLNIKNQKVGMPELVGDPDFQMDGPVLVFRLSPVDYHRFHMMDSAKFESERIIDGDLYTVHPMAWSQRPEVFFRNRRHVFHFQTENFGKIVMIAVGGFCVGRIRTSGSQVNFGRGDEVGWFEMGGSTVIVCGEPGAFHIDPDILTSSQEMIESFTCLGDQVARSKQTSEN